MFVSGWKWNSGIKDGPLPSLAVLWIVSVCEENPGRKKKVCEKLIFKSYKNMLNKTN